MSQLNIKDVQKTQEIARRLNLKLTGWQFAQLASEISAIRQEASQTNQIKTLHTMFDGVVHGMYMDLKQKTEKGQDNE